MQKPSKRVKTQINLFTLRALPILWWAPPNITAFFGRRPLCAWHHSVVLKLDSRVYKAKDGKARRDRLIDGHTSIHLHI